MFQVAEELEFLTRTPMNQMLDLRDSFLLIISERKNAVL
jgi:hypothetical protein